MNAKNKGQTDSSSNSNQKNDEYFTIKELATYSKVGICTLYEAIRSRELVHMKVGRKVIVHKSDYDAWFRRRTRQPVPYEVIEPKKKETKKPAFSKELFN